MTGSRTVRNESRQAMTDSGCARVSHAGASMTAMQATPRTMPDASAHGAEPCSASMPTGDGIDVHLDC